MSPAPKTTRRAMPSPPYENGELEEPIVVEQRHVAAVATQAMVEDRGGVRVVEIAPAPVGIRVRAQQVEGEAAPAPGAEDVDGGHHVVVPGLDGHVELDVEDAARHRV